ncbi:MAG: MATE family efflux transporter [Psychrobacter sp.]|nr:MATE family efflux transporter [Psychrobacter sp.]
MTQSVNVDYRHIIAIAIPVVLANLAMPLQGVIDTAIVGHMPSAANLAGMGLALQLLTLLLVSFNFLQYASSGLSAQALGEAARSSDALKSSGVTQLKLLSILQRALLIALVLGVLILLLKPWVITIGLKLLAANPQSSLAAQTYLNIRFYSVIAELMNFVFIGWFAGQGRTRYLLYQQTAIAALNIILTLTFVYIADMGLAGVALGTALAYWIGFVIAILLVKSHLQLSWGELIQIDRADMAKDKLLRLFSLNKDIFIRTFILTISFAWVTRLAASTGDLMLAATTILLQVLTISALALDGVAVAAESLSGQSVGLGDKQQFDLVIFRTGMVSYGLAAALTLIWWLAMPYYLPLMTDHQEVIQLAFEYRWYAIILPVIGVGAYWLDGIFFGLTAGHVIRNAAIILAVVFFPLSYLLYLRFDTHGIFLSVCSLLLLRLGILGIYLLRLRKEPLTTFQ